MKGINWKKEILTIPNLLSLFRLILIPVYVYIYLTAKSDQDYMISAIILAISCLTDLADGQIARRFNMISNVGKVLDPLADKLTQFTLAVCLAIRHWVIWIMVGLILVKELFQLIIGAINLRKGRMLKGALFSGKICTTILFTSLVVMVLFPYLNETVITIITLVDIAFLLYAFVDYAITYYKRPDKFNYFSENS